MTQNDRRGGSSAKTTRVSENEQTSLADKLKFVLGQLKVRQEEIEAVLPPDIPFDHFYAVVNQAMRNNPDVLQATAISIVNACVKAAYDGLRLDGREAALVTHNVKVSKNPDRWEVQAQYFPMVFGLVQQVLRGGEIIALEPTIIYANDEYEIRRGTNAGIHHVPLIDGDRGKPIAAYSIATYRTGYVGFEFMTEAQILDVRAASKAGQDKDGNPIGIWKRWPDAMWKKTVIRQHRKTLPLGGRDIYDAEAREQFPEFERGPAIADQSGRPRPQRQGRAALEHSGGEAGVSLDFGTGADDREGVVINGTTGEVESQTKKAAATSSSSTDRAADLPEDDAAWGAWAKDVVDRISAAKNEQAIRAIEQAERERIIAATSERRDFIKNLITDRLADMASDAAAEQAQGSESN